MNRIIGKRVVRVMISTRSVEARGPETSVCLQVCCGSCKYVARWRVIKGIESAKPAAVQEQRSK
jgi:hypothetical protein